MPKKLRITWKKSDIGNGRRQRATVRALGLKRLWQSVEHMDTPVIRGMINRVEHLVSVEEIQE